HLTDTQRERMVDVHWAPTEGSVFLVAIQVEALDRTRLLSDVSRVLSDQHVNIMSATVTTSRDRIAVSKFTFEMGDPKHLGHVLRAVRAIDGVYDVYRVTSSARGTARLAGELGHGLLGIGEPGAVRRRVLTAVLRRLGLAATRCSR